MTTVLFKNVCDVDSLFRLTDRCAGQVNLKLDDGMVIPMQGNAAVKHLLSEACGKNGIEKISLEIMSKKDMPLVISYLLSCNHAPVCHSLPIVC